MLGRTGLRSGDKTLPPGALVTFLHKGLQYVGVEESMRQAQAGESSAVDGKARSSRTSPVESSNGAETFPSFSLLSPTAMASISRETPPIQLNVPPAAAAAAVKARLAAQAKQKEQEAEI